MLGLIFNALITIIDGIFVGQGVGPDGIAAVNIIAPLLISFNYGAMSYDRVKAAFALSLKVAALCGVVVFVSIAFGAKALVSMFISPDCDAGRLAVYGLPIYAACAVLFAVSISFIGYCQSVEKAGKSMVLRLIRGVVILVPLFHAIPAVFPQWGIWAAIPASEALTLNTIVNDY